MSVSAGPDGPCRARPSALGAPPPGPYAAAVPTRWTALELAVVTRSLALLALVAGAIGLWVVVIRLLGERAPAALRPGVALGRQGAIVLASAVASVATAGSLYYSEVAQYTPCRLCWYQRIGMYPLVLLLGIGAWRDDPSVRRYALPLAAAGGMVSAYHYLLQWFPQLQTGACDPSAPCAAFYVREFGFVSIPFMALMGFVAIGALLTTVRRSHTEAS